ncbi:MAG: hypothetical protein JW822_13930 [Spirochaetales bacterium]|nr:hypothetical protein [Spirochaetales bacterium]
MGTKKGGKEKVLVIVIENNDSLGETLEDAFAAFTDECLEIFSDILEIDADDMDGMDLVDIVDTYFEDWQIAELTAIAHNHYDHIISFTDEQATGVNFLNTLRSYNTEDYVIDVIFNLHGSQTGNVSFFDAPYAAADINDVLIAEGIMIRALYQTCCHGSTMIDEWEAGGIIAVNGANNVNSLVIFSPLYFLENWIAGDNYQTAVTTATAQEITKIKSYTHILPFINMLFTQEVLDNSTQQVGGSNPQLLF